jgi:hypothetical protein
VAALDIARVLADRDGVTFRAHGTCMYPALRPGDVLRIRPCAVADVAVGDIAVCRTPTYLFSHRVIAKGEEEGRGFIVTRPDRASEGGDPPTFDEDLLGVVTSIRRGGSEVSPRTVAEGATLPVARRAGLALTERRMRAREQAARAVARLQALPGYGALARRWYARRRPRLTLLVHVPLNAAVGEALSREVAAASCDPSEPWNGRPTRRWTLLARVGEAREPAAWMRLARHDEHDWRLVAADCRIRYRRSGLEEALLREAQCIAERGGGRLVAVPPGEREEGS